MKARKTLRVCGAGIGALLTLFATYVALLAFPGVLFAHQAEHGRFTVHSSEDLGDGLETVLRDVEATLATSELYDPALEYDVFFGHANTAFGWLQRSRARLLELATGIPGGSPTYNASWPPYFNHIVSFYVPDARSNSLVHPDGPQRANIDLTRILTHEAVHSLQMAAFGLAAVARSPRWKQEGYADYVAASTILADPSYDIRASVERILQQDVSWMTDEEGHYLPIPVGRLFFSMLLDEEGRSWHLPYYVSRVLMEYLLDVKGMTYAEVMSPRVTDADTLEELLPAYESGTL